MKWQVTTDGATSLNENDICLLVRCFIVLEMKHFKKKVTLTNTTPLSPTFLNFEQFKQKKNIMEILSKPSKVQWGRIYKMN